jgi:hypothetical protein
MSDEISKAKEIIDTQLKHLSDIGSKVKMRIETQSHEPSVRSFMTEEIQLSINQSSDHQSESE